MEQPTCELLHLHRRFPGCVEKKRNVCDEHFSLSSLSLLCIDVSSIFSFLSLCVLVMSIFLPHLSLCAGMCLIMSSFPSLCLVVMIMVLFLSLWLWGAFFSTLSLFVWSSTWFLYEDKQLIILNAPDVQDNTPLNDLTVITWFVPLPFTVLIYDKLYILSRTDFRRYSSLFHVQSQYLPFHYRMSTANLSIA